MKALIAEDCPKITSTPSTEHGDQRVIHHSLRRQKNAGARRQSLPGQSLRANRWTKFTGGSPEMQGLGLR
jgi:hypothetical protein